MKKLIIINSSPRKDGNSDVLTAAIGQAAEKSGAQVRYLYLREDIVDPCRGCNACKGMDKAGCVQKDAFAALIDELSVADALALVGPVYYGTINGPAKTFIDRSYCFFDPARGGLVEKSGKKLAIAFTFGGGPAAVYGQKAEEIAGMCHTLGAGEHKVLLTGDNMALGCVKDKPEVMAEAQALGVWLAQ